MKLQDPLKEKYQKSREMIESTFMLSYVLGLLLVRQVDGSSSEWDADCHQSPNELARIFGASTKRALSINKNTTFEFHGLSSTSTSSS